MRVADYIYTCDRCGVVEHVQKDEKPYGWVYIRRNLGKDWLLCETCDIEHKTFMNANNSGR